MKIAKVSNKIHFIRGQRVLLDRDLAALYHSNTGALNRAVRRNSKRFPGDFMFQLTRAEWEILRCQTGISRWGGRRARPYAFTEHGVAMLSSVLSSQRAVQVNIAIMRTFVMIRQALAGNKELADRLDRLELDGRRHSRVLSEHKGQFLEIFEAIRRMIEPPLTPRKRIGFTP